MGDRAHRVAAGAGQRDLLALGEHQATRRFMKLETVFPGS
jgi:hypothetical protein